MDVRPDPGDRLPALECGEWSEDKHELLRQYIDCSHATRRRWLNGTNGATYIELFCGPGRLYIKGTGTFVDGSPLVAHREAARTDTVFSAMHLGDERKDFCDATETRLKALLAKPVMYAKSGEIAAREIQRALNPYALHFAFLDPFGFDDLPISIIRTFAGFRRMDMLIYVSAMELQRKLPEYFASKDCSLDRFAPGWRDAVRGLNPHDTTARGKIFEHWLSLIRQAGFGDAAVTPLIRGPSNQALYWLVLIAKHDLARRLWNSIAKRQTPNQSLFGN